MVSNPYTRMVFFFFFGQISGEAFVPKSYVAPPLVCVEHSKEFLYIISNPQSLVELRGIIKVPESSISVYN